MKDPLKKVIELIRVSTKGQADDDRASIPAQRAINRRTCIQYGLEIVYSIEISDVSGAAVLLAPEIQELKRLMQSPTISGVVAREFSRLMRPDNFTDYTLLQAFVDSKSILFLPDGPIDLNTKTGRLVGTIRAAIAGSERSEILERMWSAKEEKRKRGELAQSLVVLPFGIGYEKDCGFFYKPEAERVRDAFQQFLSGNQSYLKLSKIVGVTPRGMHLILRNPIWTGWRVIDKKRDASFAGKYEGIDGRQTDRRKIARAPEDVIRVQVIREPLISQSDFEATQRIMDLKQGKHWRARTGYAHRFTYNGFLTCSTCGEVVHTAFARRDYYACKGRRATHNCETGYMGRERLEGVLDGLFAEYLTDVSFLERCIDRLRQRSAQKDSGTPVKRLTAEIDALNRKRGRVIDAFIEGVLSRQERDERLTSIDHGIHMAQNGLAREVGPTSLDAAQLTMAFAPLAEWNYWTRDQKRLVLSALVPEIRVADYQIESLGLSPTIFSTEHTRKDKDSSPPPA
jgi:DNA invertase Pin-like site-specific DNA recombinase